MAASRITRELPAVAPRARQLTRQEWLARALELAERANMVYRTKYLGRNVDGYEVFTAPSQTHQNMTHVQLVNPVAHTVVCHCTAGSYGNPCCHAGAAWKHWSVIVEAMSEAGQRANREYLAFGAFLESRGY